MFDTGHAHAWFGGRGRQTRVYSSVDSTRSSDEYVYTTATYCMYDAIIATGDQHMHVHLCVHVVMYMYVHVHAEGESLSIGRYKKQLNQMSIV